MRRIPAALALCLAGAACTAVGPDYSRPEVAVPEQFHGAPSAEVARSEQDLLAWWTRFGDPVLVDLVDRALAGNLDVRIAAARIREARARERIAGASALPVVEAQGSATYNRISENAVSPAGIGTGGGQPGGGGAIGFPGMDFEAYRVGFDASWELDLFGGTRRAVEAARARTGAALWQRRDAELSVAAEVASAYLALRTLQQRILLAEAERDRQARYERIVRARVQGGMASGLDLRQQQSERARAVAAVPPLRAQEQQQVHILGVLTGAAPDSLYPMLGAPAAIAPLPPPVPAGLPSDLLRRRPDIRGAERDVAAATADVGVAVADLYPRISLTASPALVSQSLADLVEWGSRNLTAGIGIAWPLFAGGRLQGAVEAADARQEQALLAYRRTVLVALRDVEDALGRYAEGERRLEALEQALESARQAERLARVRYGNGLVSLSDVLAVQARRIATEEQAVETRGTRARDLVALYKALGGGWDAEPDLAAAGAGALR